MASVTDMRAILRADRRAFTVTRLLRVAGTTLLTAGVLLAGFVLYQLVVTDMMANRAQDGLAVEFRERAAAVQPVQVEYRPEVPLPESPFAAEPVPAVAGPDPVVVEPAGPDPAVVEVPTILTEPVPAVGQAVGRITIESAGVDWTVVEGVGRSQLRTGTGHLPSTPLPGQPGNAVISGHRTTYGAPFANLDRVQPGDRITVETAIGIHVYETVEVLIVEPRDLWVTDQWDGAWLTLTTCHPRFSARQRLIVVAQLVDGPNAAAIGGGS